MLDIHVHILPGLDDGPSDWDETMRMCRMAREDGTEKIVASPHALNGLYNSCPAAILKKTQELNQRLKDASMDLEVLPGSEVYASPDCADRVIAGEALTVNNGGKYMLLELPVEVVPAGIESLVFSLLLKGITPIISHPERNREICRKPELLLSMVQKGALSQITAGSIIGGFGRRIQECSRQLLRANLAHAIASDAHSSSGRPPVLSEAREACAALIGEDRARELTEEYPKRILEGTELLAREPELESRKEGFFSFFSKRNRVSGR